MSDIEPILEEVKKWKGTAAVALFNVEVLKEEVERLRGVLKKIAQDPQANWYVTTIARSALQQKESE